MYRKCFLSCGSWLLALAVLVSHSTLAKSAEAFPPPFTAVYLVKKAGLTLGEVTVTLNYDHQRYTYRKRTRSRGLLALFRNDVITETSHGRMDGAKLTMENYHYRHEGSRHREISVRLVNGNLIKEQYAGQDYEYEVPAQTLDRASVEIALMRDAALKNAPERLVYPIAERGRAKQLIFQRIGETKEATPAGTFACIEYQVERNNNKRSTRLCVAPAIHFLPVVVTHTEKGTSFSMRLKKYQFD